MVMITGLGFCFKVKTLNNYKCQSFFFPSVSRRIIALWPETHLPFSEPTFQAQSFSSQASTRWTGHHQMQAHTHSYLGAILGHQLTYEARWRSGGGNPQVHEENPAGIQTSTANHHRRSQTFTTQEEGSKWGGGGVRLEDPNQKFEGYQSGRWIWTRL